jgi:hypothetical protein
LPVREDHRRQGLLFLAAFLFLLARTPHALTHGYVLAEEGTVYLRYAWDAPPVRALFAPHQSYYSLLPNVCGLIAARLLPLEDGGIFLVWSALAVQLLFVFLVLQSEIFTSLRVKAVAVAVCLLTVPNSNMALSTITSQFYLALCAGVVFLSDPRRLRWLRLVTVAFAGMNGLLSCILLPFFLWAACVERTRERIRQAALLSLCSALQAAVVLHMAPVQSRTLLVHSSLHFLLGAYLVNGPLTEFFTRWAGAVECRDVVTPGLMQSANRFWLFTEASAVAALGLQLTLLLRAGPAARRLTALAFFSLAAGLNGALAQNEMLMCGFGARYFFVGNVFVALALVCAWGENPATNRAIPRVAGFLLTCLVFSGVTDLFFVLRSQAEPPDWQSEVAAWRADPNHPIRIHPQSWPWLILSPRHANADLPANVYDSNNLKQSGPSRR